MNPETQIFYSRLALFLVFISFWLATPEMIGENKLKAIGVSSLSSIIRLLLGLGIFGSAYLMANLSDIVRGRPFTVSALLGILTLGRLDVSIPLVILLVIWIITFFIFAFVINFHPREDEILSNLFYNKDGRRTLLKIGALLFVIGAVFQLLAI